MGLDHPGWGGARWWTVERTSPWAAPGVGAIVAGVLAVGGHWPLLTTEPGFVLIVATVCAALTATGFVLLRTQPRPASGVGFLATGVSFGFAGVDAWPVYGPALAFLFAGPFLLPLGWALFRYRNPALSPAQRLWLGAAILFIGGGTLAQVALSRPEWNKYPAGVWWPTLYGDELTYTVLTAVLLVAWLGLGVSFSLLQARRVREANFFDRRALAPIALGSIILAIACAVVFGLFYLLPAWFTWRDAYALLGLVMALLLIAFLASLAARLGLQTKLLTELPRLPTPDAVTHYLRTVMEDPTLDLLFYDRTSQTYLTGDGRPANLGESVPERETLRNGRGEVVAALSARETTLEVWRDLEEFRLVVVGAIENAQLQAVLIARALELGAARRDLLEQRHGSTQLQRDLHDTVQQTLYATRLEVSGLDEPSQGSLDTVVEKIDRAISQVRLIARGAPPIARSASIETIVATCAEELGLDVSVVVHPVVAPQLDEDIVAICTEALTNVHKHAHATETLVRVHSVSGELRLEIMDNGIGGAQADPRGGGVSGMRARVNDLGGRFELHSTPGNGTKVIAAWPSRSGSSTTTSSG